MIQISHLAGSNLEDEFYTQEDDRDEAFYPTVSKLGIVIHAEAKRLLRERRD
jgi:hypothetical protein